MKTTLETSEDEIYTRNERRWKLHSKRVISSLEYIHRVGRTARGANGKGKGVIILMPEELGRSSLVSSVVSGFTRFECSFRLHSF